MKNKVREKTWLQEAVPDKLAGILRQYDGAAIAFSGGVDSSYLLYAAKAVGLACKAYFVQSEFQPRFEWDDALRLAEILELDLEKVALSTLNFQEIRENGAKRCYYCKQKLFEHICAAAKRDGFSIVFDGSNAADDTAERPGMKALEELGIISPLRLAGMSKEDVRACSKKAGLFTWNKPAYACLATRIPEGVPLSATALQAVEEIEEQLFNLGFRNFRARILCGPDGIDGADAAVKLEVTEGQMEKAIGERKAIFRLIAPFCKTVYLDLNAR